MMRPTPDNVIGELVHTFLLPVEKRHLTTRYEDQHVPLKYGGTRKVQLEVVTIYRHYRPVTTEYPRIPPEYLKRPATTEIKVTLLNHVMGERLSGELYYEITPGQKKMIRHQVAAPGPLYGRTESWEADQNDLPKGTIHI